MAEEKTQLSKDTFDEVYKEICEQHKRENSSPKLTDEQLKILHGLFETLGIDPIKPPLLDLTESEISAIEAQEYEARCREAKRDRCICDCCGHALDTPELNSSFFGYVTCPNCAYIQHIPNSIRLTRYTCDVIVVDQEGNKVLDHNGRVRLFANKHIAKEYIRYCKMEDNWNVELDYTRWRAYY